MSQPHAYDFSNGPFQIPQHDYQEHSGSTADHGPTQIIYKKGGVNGKLVATETITYDAFHYVATRHIEWANDIFI